MYREHTEKEIQNMKIALEKDHKREFTRDEVIKALNDIRVLAHITFDIYQNEQKKLAKLNEFPNGYHLDGSGTCLICSQSASNENTWFDKYGLKCMTCQKAINLKIIPAAIAQKRESWYSKHELETFFNFKYADTKRYIKQAILTSRTICTEQGKPYLELFLIKDNKEFLPPKKLLKSRPAKVIIKGEEYYTQEYWYEYVDQKLLKQLAKYKIVECLKETMSKPIKSGRFYHKEMSPIFKPNNLK